MGAHSSNALAQTKGSRGERALRSPRGQHLPRTKWSGCPKLTRSSPAFPSCSAWGCSSRDSCRKPQTHSHSCLGYCGGNRDMNPSPWPFPASVLADGPINVTDACEG